MGGICGICGKAGHLRSCSLCGKRVCAECMGDRGVCKSCEGGRFLK